MSQLSHNGLTVSTAKWLGALLVAELSVSAIADEMPARRVLEEVLVTAQKREQRLEDVPVSINLLSSEYLSDSRITTAKDISLIEPSITWNESTTQSSQSVSMRGLGTYSSDVGMQPSVSIVVDGAPLARSGQFQVVLSDIERIEILRGPQGTLFGTNATAGAINIVRKKPTSEFEASLQSSYTTDDELMVNGMVSGPLTEKVLGRLVLYRQDREGHIDNVYPGAEKAGGQDLISGPAKLAFDFNENVNLLLSMDYTKDDTGYTPGVTIDSSDDPTRAARLGPGWNFNDINTINQDIEHTSNIINSALTAELNWQINDSWSLVSVTGYHGFEATGQTDIDLSPARPVEPLGAPFVSVNRTNISRVPANKDPLQLQETDYVSQELRLNLATEQFDWVSGVYFQRFSDRFRSEVTLMLRDDVVTGGPSTGSYFANATITDGDMSLDSYAFFTDVTWHLTDRLDVFAGFRWTEEKANYDHFVQSVFVPASAPFFVPGETISNFDMTAVDAAITAGVPLVNNVTTFDKDKDLGEWSGRIGASYEPRDGINVYTSLSRGFVGIAFDPGRAPKIDNPFIDHTVSEAFEIGLKSRLFDNTLNLNLAAFIQNTEDLQVSRLAPGTVVNETLNAGELRNRGVEGSMIWQATSALSVSAAVTWMDTEFGELDQLCYAGQTAAEGCTLDVSGDGIAESQSLKGSSGITTPDLAYNLSLRYDVPGIAALPFDLYGFINYSWQDEIQFLLTHDPLTEQDAYGLLDLTLGLTDKEGRYELSLFGKNILDQEYYGDLNDLSGIGGRVITRTPRGAQAYWGLLFTYNFD